MRVRTHVNPLTYVNRMDKFDYSKVLPDIDNKFLDFEIGFGNGVFLKKYAKKHPERNIIGIEIRKPVAFEVRDFVFNEGISNAYIMHGKAEICLEDTILNNFLDRIFLFHPDPWFKKRHHKRRVVQDSFLDLVYLKLKENGCFYISTDVKDLWDYMNELILKYNKFKVVDDNIFWTEDYLTHWDSYSKQDNRQIFYGTFMKK